MNNPRNNDEEFTKNNKLILLQSQQRLWDRKHSVFFEDVIKVASSANDDTKIQSIDATDKYLYLTSKDLAFKKEEIKWKNIVKQYRNDWLWLYCQQKHKKA